MKLIHPYVDIVPGRPGMRPNTPAISDKIPLPGSAVVRLTNATEQENAYTVKLRCEDTLWQEGWYSLVSLPPDPSKGENAPPAGKADQRGPQDRWVKVFVPRGGTRDILVRFNVPQRPECRAGKYPYRIEVETQIVGPAASARRSDRITELSGVAVVQPYYQWSLDVSPQQRRVGRTRRSTIFDVIVTNEGNDWLYCDLQINSPKEILVESPVSRIAVPPPEPGETVNIAGSPDPHAATQRLVPIRVKSRLTILRGNVTTQNLPLTAVRIDAPSVPPAFEDGVSASATAVVADATTEVRTLPAERALLYCPPVPATITDFFERSGSSIRALIMTVIGLVIAANLLMVMYENVWHNNVQVEPMTLSASTTAPLPVRGRWLEGSAFFVGDDKDGYTPVDAKFSLSTVNPCTIMVPSSYDHKLVKIRVQRVVRWLPFLTPLLPSYTSLSQVQVGKPIGPAAAVVPPEISDLASGSKKPGDTFTVRGKGLGAHGVVMLNNAAVNAVSWQPDAVTVAIPLDAAAGQMIVQLLPDGTTNPLPAGAVSIAATPAAAGAAPGGALPVALPLPAAGGGGGAPAPAPGPAPSPTPTPTSAPRPAPAPAPHPVTPRPVHPAPHTNPTPTQATSPTPSSASSSTTGGGTSAKDALLAQINTEKAALASEEAAVVAQQGVRDQWYAKVRGMKVNQRDTNSVNNYNNAINSANDANNQYVTMFNNYNDHLRRVQAMIDQYNGMR